MNHEIKYFTFLMICARIIKAVRGIFRFPFYSWNASVAQWIEQCPPEACAAVRLRSDAYNRISESALNAISAALSGIFIFQKGAQKGQTIKSSHS